MMFKWIKKCFEEKEFKASTRRYWQAKIDWTAYQHVHDIQEMHYRNAANLFRRASSAAEQQKIDEFLEKYLEEPPVCSIDEFLETANLTEDEKTMFKLEFG